jgi:hydroxyversicolorone monooxygenase
MRAIQEPNVDVHFSAVKKITEDSVIDEEGNERKVDTIICATGFDVSYRPRFPIVGQNGVELGEKWKVCPEAYLGITIPDIPNFITFIGPSWPIANGELVILRSILLILADSLSKLIMFDFETHNGSFGFSFPSFC